MLRLATDKIHSNGVTKGGRNILRLYNENQL